MTARVFPPRLTLSQKKEAQSGFLYFATINAFSYSALAESVLVLYGLKLGANDFHIGLLSSYIHLTTIFVLLGKAMVARWGAARTYSTCWFFRNLMGGLLLLAPWIYQHYSPNLGLYWLLGSSFLFFAFRSMGVSSDNILINDITSENDRGRFIGQAWFWGYAAMVSMLVAVSFWLRGNPSFFHFQVLVGVGCVLGMTASIFLGEKAPVPDSRLGGSLFRYPASGAFPGIGGQERLLYLGPGRGGFCSFSNPGYCSCFVPQFLAP
jgi:hypothetical protein